MRRLAIVTCLAVLTVTAARLPAVATVPAGNGVNVTPGVGVELAQHRRCTPSRCGCQGDKATFCTRDCRRDITCACVRGRYLCRKVSHR